MGDIYITTLSINPATRFLGTTWQKIEGRFLLSTSGSNASGQTGGSNTKTISKANLPAVKVQVDSFTLTTQPHTHPYVTPIVQWVGSGGWDGQGWSQHITSTTGTGGGQNTGTAAPYTSALGSGTPLDITPAYYTVHIWKRLS
ncbi:phage baseplate protein [Fusobacterium sp. THCT1E2]